MNNKANDRNTGVSKTSFGVLCFPGFIMSMTFYIKSRFWYEAHANFAKPAKTSSEISKISNISRLYLKFFIGI